MATERGGREGGGKGCQHRGQESEGEDGIRIWGTRHSKDMRHANLVQEITLKEHKAASQGRVQSLGLG